ncbi:MAG: T9SS type A sorting domain-containing protein [Candidatus Cloacimonetes bacterium]|nr:T9SS type A sorting domain-containing protein [Candidatus Cloacimonadota bacterium]MCF7814147.1 T9SS type A sorting domain-containing protein [Candidatus Cloacimonadota bacterium]MCF7868754.1 T9SS type A sorting domain-containing protein [Candidatus Cloacimonadota bacterium]MCF7884146.1 T9SS type A sorting domain-containing protein [Candidatus Cloacimonadota bacterium]
MRFLFVSAILLIIVPCFAVVEETAEFKDFLYGTTTSCTYDNWLSHISEGIANEDYNLYAPYDNQTDGFGDFLIATDSLLLVWEGIFSLFLAQDFDAAQDSIDNADLPFEVVQFNDIETNQTFYLIRELLNLDYVDDNGTTGTYDDEVGSFDFGWGLYVYNPSASNPIIITVPHPNDDFIVPPMASEAFVKWDAKFLMINGAGREVKWTEQGGYSNSKSLSDPSRIEEHALTRAYQLSCDLIRSEFSMRELSTQIHSYDWDRHDNHPDCQISAGNSSNPNLPIRDLSSLHDDIINQSDHLMWEENSIGTHSAVYLNDYYSVNYNLYDFYFYDDFGRHYPVNDNVDLPGYSGNRQMIYTKDDWNNYDVFEPFFHIEMDELPNAYEENEQQYFWFYGYDANLQQFNYDELFQNTIDYYTPWIDAMTAALQNSLPPDDNEIPATPQDFIISDQYSTFINLEWEPVSCYDFYSYEIMYATEPITPTNYVSHTRDDWYLLADPNYDSYSIFDLELNQEYYFRIRAIDYSGNVSAESSELFILTAPVEIAEQNAYGLDNEAVITWTAEQQVGNQGFNLYQVIDEDLILIDSWQTNPALQGSTIPNQTYEYVLENLENNRFYQFKLGYVNNEGNEYFEPSNISCKTRDIYYLSVKNESETLMDTIWFSMNFYATSNYDDYYDVTKDFSILPEYVFASFYEPDWGANGMHLERNIKNEINMQILFHSWDLRLVSNTVNESYRISLDPTFTGERGNLYLEDPVTGQVRNLQDSDMFVILENEVEKSLILRWGSYNPSANVVIPSYTLFPAGSEMNINWNTYNSNLIEQLELNLVNSETTFPIASHISPSSNNYSWQIPDNITMLDASVELTVYDFAGNPNQAVSYSQTGIVPSNNSLSGPSGWQLVANPWYSDVPFDVEDVFGNESNIYSQIDHYQYEPTSSFEFGKGYWLQSAEDFVFESTLPIATHSISVDLHPEWNLIPNPHLCEYDYYDLRFNLNGYSRTYPYMVILGKIADGVYTFENGAYKRVEKMLPGKSYYIYSYTSQNDELSCNFRPFNHSNPSVAPFDWQIEITASQEYSDNLILGTSNQASVEFDHRFDLPEPPNPPFADNMQLLIDKHGVNTFPYRKLQQEFKPSLNASIADTVSWDFYLKPSNMNSITMEFDLTSLPANCYASINLDGNSWCNLVNNVYIYSFSPSQNRILQGNVEIRNEFTNTPNDVHQISLFSTYPNPFNPKTVISFDLATKSNVKIEVYNIKGQLVKTVLNERLTAGNHRVEWNGADQFNKKAASGIYFIKLKTADHSQMIKTLLLK